MTIDKATLDKLLEGVDPSNPQSMFTDAGLFGQLKKALAERMLQAELTHHLAQQRNGPEPRRNHRNGSSKKSVLAAETKLELDIPRDRDGSLSRSSWPSTSAVYLALTTRLSRCTRAACRCARSKVI